MKLFAIDYYTHLHGIAHEYLFSSFFKVSRKGKTTTLRWISMDKEVTCGIFIDYSKWCSRQNWNSYELEWEHEEINDEKIVKVMASRILMKTTHLHFRYGIWDNDVSIRLLIFHTSKDTRDHLSVIYLTVSSLLGIKRLFRRWLSANLWVSIAQVGSYFSLPKCMSMFHIPIDPKFLEWYQVNLPCHSPRVW